jgi:hypothetical protein
MESVFPAANGAQVQKEEDKLTPDAFLLAAPRTDLSTPNHSLQFASGRKLHVTENDRDELLCVRAPDGQIMLSIRLTDEGPVLSLSAVSLELAARKHISLASETLAIRTSGDATVDVGGALHERTRGNAIREVGKASIERAREVKIEAAPGGIVINANDDVAITGERVKLNSDDPPMPLTWDEHRARQAARLAKPNDRPELVLPDLTTLLESQS